MGESLAIQQIGMARTQEEPVRQPIVRSSSIAVSGRAEVLWYGMELLRGCGGAIWWENLVEPKFFIWKGSSVLPENLVGTRTKIMTI
jgi:hypothetical protein